jgi:eukaryotic-like serine/threonine-protein kinase
MLLADRYQLIQPLRAGGMAVVYQAMDRLLEREVAVKRLKAEYATEATFREQFAREARLLAGMPHPNIVKVFDIDPDMDRPFMVLELIQGHTLGQLLPLPMLQAIDYLIQVADALDFCHRHGILHCDIKPENIMVDHQGHVKLIDFGISHPAGSSIKGDIIGSPHYVAPERVCGGPLTPATDVYAFGIMLFQVITGRVPFDGPDAGSIARQHVEERVPLMSEVLLTVPLSLERVVARATAPMPLARYQHGRDLLEAMRQARLELLGEPIPAPPQRQHDICSATDFWATTTSPIGQSVTTAA